MRKLLIIFLMSFLLVFCGCSQAWNAFWSGFTETSEEADQLKEDSATHVDTANKLLKAIDENGQVDIGELKDFIKSSRDTVKDAFTLATGKKRNFLLEALFVFGLSVSAYLGTRRVRKSPVGAGINAVVGLATSIFKKSDDKKT